MSLIVSWIGIDTHGITSAYIASESRITWPDGNHFDHCKKVYASSRYPELFGYAGDVQFPSIVLSQIITMIDSNMLFTQEMSCHEKNKLVFEKILYTLGNYPDEMGKNQVQIIHISRDTIVHGYPSFHQYVLKYKRGTKPKISENSIPAKSDILEVLGSGKAEYMDNYNSKYKKSSKAQTSKNVFHCFIHTLDHTTDTTFGGPPQLVGLYRKPLTAGINFGIIYKRKRYFLGMEIPQKGAFDQGEWRNSNFELCSGITKKRLPTAKARPDTVRTYLATP